LTSSIDAGPMAVVSATSSSTMVRRRTAPHNGSSPRLPSTAGLGRLAAVRIAVEGQGLPFEASSERQIALHARREPSMLPVEPAEALKRLLFLASRHIAPSRPAGARTPSPADAKAHKATMAIALVPIDRRAKIADCADPKSVQASNLEPFLSDFGVGFDVGGGAFEHDAAVAHHVEPARDAHRDRQLLLHLAHVSTPGGPTGPAQPLFRCPWSPPTLCSCPSAWMTR
jgi:hypothetical protein